MTNHVTTGRSARSHLSEALCVQFLHSPQGWTLCGLLGLQAMITPRSRMWTILIDWLTGEPNHCAIAVERSIDRAKTIRYQDYRGRRYL